jgi:hypothetical protein
MNRQTLDLIKNCSLFTVMELNNSISDKLQIICSLLIVMERGIPGQLAKNRQVIKP